jgi:2-polyprenyl-6-methoxyphenol hydroxylase-like FAD-dependent oxidoreductase
LHVVIVGGGIGGLCLAQGLVRQGIGVEVHERDKFPGSRWEGYRIDIEEMGMRALHACLPTVAWEQFMATSFVDDRMTFMDEQLKVLLKVDGSLIWPKRGDLGGRLGVDRPTMRRVLQTGLGGLLRFDAEFVRYEHESDGRVTAVFADGRRATGDCLIGADGTTSRVAAQYLPGAEWTDSGFSCVGIKHPLTNESRRWLPEPLTHGVAFVMSGTPVFGFNAAFDPPRASGVEPYVLHAVSWNAEAGGNADPDGKDEATVRAMLMEKTASWHRTLRRLFAEPVATATLRLRAVKPPPPWTPSRVVLLGDALHAMPPTAGRGGNTALRDAHLLARELGAVAAGRKNLLDAVASYETDAREYATATIAESLRNIRMCSTTGSLRYGLIRMFLRACSLVTPLRERVFAGPVGSGAIRPWEEDRLPAQAESGTASAAPPG